MRLPRSLLEDDYLDPHLVAQDSTYETHGREAMRLAAARGRIADLRAISAAEHSRQRTPLRPMQRGEPVHIHRRRDGAQGCGPGICVLSGERLSGRNETRSGYA